jgi:hypothetical protein
MCYSPAIVIQMQGTPRVDAKKNIKKEDPGL